MSYEDDLYHLVNEVHHKVEAVDRALDDSENARTTRELPGGLGTVTVTGAGQLTDVSLEVDALKGQSATSLGRQILRGIELVEQEALANRAAAVAAAQERVRAI